MIFRNRMRVRSLPLMMCQINIGCYLARLQVLVAWSSNRAVSRLLCMETVLPLFWDTGTTSIQGLTRNGFACYILLSRALIK